MSPRRYRAEQLAYAFLLTACGLAVAVGIVVREHRTVMARLTGPLHGHEATR